MLFLFFIYANQKQNNMKRIFTILMVLFLTIPVIAQKRLPVNVDKVPYKAEIGAKKGQAAAKSTYLYNGFNEFPGEGWTTIVNVPTETWVSGPDMLNSQGQVVVSGFNGDFAYCQWNGTSTQDEWIISPSIDLSGLQLENPLVLDFYWFGMPQWSLPPNDYCDLNIKISTDGGETWTVLFNEAEGPTDWASFTWYYASVNLDAYLGEADVKLGIQYFGLDGAQFGIDEVRIYEQFNDEVVLSSVGMANENTGYYSQLPVSQLSAESSLIYFEGAITNAGVNAQSNVKLNIDVTKDGSSVYSTTSTQAIASLASFTNDTIRIGDKDPEIGTPLYTFPQSIGTYDIEFEVEQDQTDQAPENNVKNASFKATTRHLARHTNIANSIGTNSYTDALNGDFIGTTFSLVEDETVESVSLYLSEGATVDNQFKVMIYRAATDWEIVGESVIIDITADMVGKWTNVTFEAPIALPAITDDTYNFYVVGVECYFNDISNDKMTFRADNTFNHWLNVSSRLRNGGTWYFIHYVPAFVLNFERPTYTATFDIKDQNNNPISDAIITINDTLSFDAGVYELTLMEDVYDYTVTLGELSTSGSFELIGQDAGVPVVLNGVGIQEQNVENLSIYPNPCNNNLNVIFNVGNTDQLTVKLMNVTGQEIFVENYEGFSGSFNKEFSLNNLAEGVYYLQISNSKGSSLHKVIKK